jgi:hypothetical protein
MTILLTVSGQLILLLNALWMLKTWQPKDEKPGWYAAAFCSGLLICSFSASNLMAQVIDLTPMYWFEQLGLYAAFPLLSFVLIGSVAKFDWPKEAWGRILLGVCGIYWICQQTQQLDTLILVSSIISLAMALRLMVGNTTQLCIKQKSLLLTCSLLALILIVHALFIDLERTNLELGMGFLLFTVNRILWSITTEPLTEEK